jgi:hypothetical protein
MFSMRRYILALPLAVVLVLMATPLMTLASSFSGQVAFGQAQVEPAYDGVTGQEVFVLLPDHASTQSTVTWSPLYLVMYPTNSTTGTLDCTPNNCDHVNVLDPALVASLGLGSVYPTGSISTKYGPFTGGLVKGHDHLIGVDAKGDEHVTKHVFLVMFTPQAVADGAINREITTLDALNAAMSNGDLTAAVDTGLIIHASVVSSATYLSRN